MVDSLFKKLSIFQEQRDQRSKQQEEELQQWRETYHDKKHKITIDSSANELKVSQETAHKFLKEKKTV